MGANAQMDAAMKRFNRETKRFAKTLLPAQMILFQKKIALQLLRGVVLKTPVDTGQARAGWQLSIGSPVSEEATGLDPSGSGTISNGVGALAGLGPFQVVWLSNNVGHIRFLEEGSSSQAPNGMLALTLTEVATQFERGV